MTDEERTRIAEQILALVFSLRPSGETGQAWALTVMSTALARAILATTGPTGDVETLLQLAQEQVRQLVTKAQLQFMRERLSVGSAPLRPV